MRDFFGGKLAKRILELGLTYEDLARRVGVSGVYVSKIAQGKVVPSDEIVVKLAQALDLDLEALILAAHYEKAPGEVKDIFKKNARRGDFIKDADNLDNLEPADLGHGRAVPVVGLVRAGEFALAEDGEYPPGVADRMVYTDRKGRNLFGVRVTNDSMEPEFKEGDVLIVNPNLSPSPGDYVIAKLVDDNEATFKKLVVHEGRDGSRIVILRPLNPRYSDMVFTDPEKVQLIGKVVERKTLY